MKTIKFLFLLALPLMFFTSCSDSDDMPQVSINVQFAGYYQVENDQNIYVTPDCQLYVSSLSIVSLEGKPASLGNVAYIANGEKFYITAIPPYSTEVPMGFFREGNNYFTIEMNILVEGYSVYDAAMFFNVIMVESEDELPTGATYVPGPSDDNGDNSNDMEAAS